MEENKTEIDSVFEDVVWQVGKVNMGDPKIVAAEVACEKRRILIQKQIRESKKRKPPTECCTI